jgi:hypothetical protein
MLEYGIRSLGGMNEKGRGTMRKFAIVSILIYLVCMTGSGSGFELFEAPYNYAAGDNPYSICSEDFNRDGWPDIAIVNKTSNDLYLRMNDGNGDLDRRRYTPWDTVHDVWNTDSLTATAIPTWWLQITILQVSRFF